MFRVKEIIPKSRPLNKENQFLYDFSQGYNKLRPPTPKPRWRKYEITFWVALTIWSIYDGDKRRRRMYKEQPLSTGSTALQAPSKPHVQHAPYTDIFAAPIPLAALAARVKRKEGDDSAPTKTELEEAWARSLLGSKTIRREACLVGLFTRGKWSPGDTGDSDEGFSEERVLLNGLMRVQRPPGADEGSNGLLLSWRMPDAPRVFFETIAGWGYPWRLMSGGRHELSVSDPYEDEDGLLVDVRFASTHDYEIVHEEGDLGNQKIIPLVLRTLHRAHSRLILASARQELDPMPQLVCRGGSEMLEPPPEFHMPKRFL